MILVGTGRLCKQGDDLGRPLFLVGTGRPYWTRTSDLSHVKGTRYQLR